MNKKICPACQSHRLTKGKPMSYGGVYIHLKWLKNVHPEAFVCCDCGHISLWVEDDFDLKMAQEVYEKQKSEEK